MNVETIRTNLEGQGLSPLIIDSILKSMSKPVKEKTVKRWFGQTPSKKVDIEVDVTIICECCGSRAYEKRTIKAAADGPTEMKLPVSMCNSCPDYFRAMDHETLVSLCLVRHHAGLMHQHQSVRGQVAVAKNMSPEDVVTLRTNHF